MLNALKNLDDEASSLDADSTVYLAERPMSTEMWVERVGDAPILLLSGRLPREVLRSLAGSLRHVVFLGTEPANFVDLAFCRSAGIEVHTVQGYGDDAVAEHTLAMILSTVRQLPKLDSQVKQGAWPTDIVPRSMSEVTIGVIGFGGIGRRVAELCTAVGARVVVATRTQPNPSPAELTFTTVDQLLVESDVVTLHVPLTAETHQLLDRRRLDLMKPGAILVNTARAQLVDGTALLEQLTSGRIAGLAMDVFDTEPVHPDSPLLEIESALFTPHVAFATSASMSNLLQGALRIVRSLTSVHLEREEATHEAG